MENKISKEIILLIFSVVLFGTIGLFRRHINMPSEFIAMTRGIIGAASLLLYIKLSRKKISFKKIKFNLLYLILSGAAIGFNWILLFEAYQYTTVATATLCYYTAPIFVTLLSPFLLKEHVSGVKLICIVFSLIGMILLSGITDLSFSGKGEYKGIILGISAAFLYASVILINKKMTDISSIDRTIMQLGVAGIILIPYNIVTVDISALDFSVKHIILLLVVSILHTGISYAMYFGAVKKINAQTVAIYSYIDPVTAIICSYTILDEKVGIDGLVGALLILGAAIFSELYASKK